MYDLIDLFALVCLLIDQGEIVMHQLEKVGL